MAHARGRTFVELPDLSNDDEDDDFYNDVAERVISSLQDQLLVSEKAQFLAALAKVAQRHLDALEKHPLPGLDA